MQLRYDLIALIHQVGTNSFGQEEYPASVCIGDLQDTVQLHQSYPYMVIVRTKHDTLVADQLFAGLTEVNERKFVMHTQPTSNISYRLIGGEGGIELTSERLRSSLAALFFDFSFGSFAAFFDYPSSFGLSLLLLFASFDLDFEDFTDLSSFFFLSIQISLKLNCCKAKPSRLKLIMEAGHAPKEQK